MKRLLALLAIVVTAVLVGLTGSVASAHPLGNFSVNTATRIDVYADGLRIQYVVDMAEIPALQERQRIDADGDGAVSAAESEAYLAEAVLRLMANLAVLVGDDRVAPELLASTLAFAPGEAGLETLRIHLNLAVGTPAGGDSASIQFSDANYEGRAGYHEVSVAAAPGVDLVRTDAPAQSPTELLTASGLGDRDLPPNQRTSSFVFVPGAGQTAPAAPVLASDIVQDSGGGIAESPLSRFLESDRLTLSTMALLLLIALALGAVHALEPGHGKSIVAAYFIGTRGSALQAALLGLVVAITHSIGVVAVAALVLYGSQYFVPEDAYPWLTVASGVMVLGLGSALLLSRLRAAGAWHRLQHMAGGRHRHGQEHAHPHGGHAPSTPLRRDEVERPPWKGLIALGLIDGLIPTPSTLVVLLGAIAIGRIELGLLMVVAFSTGMALVMTSISLAVLAARAFAGALTDRLGGNNQWLGGLAARGATLAPAGAAIVLLVVGATIVARGVVQVTPL